MGRALGAVLREAAPGELRVVALAGPLGAGKTLFVRGLAEGLGHPGELVTSPTYVIAQEYRSPGAPRLAHIDLYRVGSAAELEATGFLDLLAPDTVLAVEWADRLPEALPEDRLEVRIRPEGAAGRRIGIAGRGAAAEARLRALRRRLSAEEGAWR